MNDIVSVLIYLVAVVILWWALQHAIKTLEPVAEHGSGHAPAHDKPADDLTKIEGIGPKISQILSNEGIATFATLAATEESRLEEILEAAGSRFSLAEPETWPEQAELAAAGKWDELTALQDRLTGGRE
jgi:large subunit ribosomal protein L17